MFTNRIPWVVLLLAWMVGSTWWHVCKIKLLCTDDASHTTSAAIPVVFAPALRVSDGQRFRFNAAGNFTFARSGAVANRRGVGALLDSLTDYLKANPGKTLTIIGHYAPPEQNSTAFANLGLARADGIKRVLQQAGLADSLFVVAGVKKNELTFSTKGDSLYGGLAFAFSSPAYTSPATTTTNAATPAPLTVLTESVTETDLANKEKFTSVFEPIDLYFPLSEATYIRTEETTKFFEEAIAFLTKNKDKQLVLTGYTDDKGPEAVNLQLSLDRANSIKARLRKSGVATSQIQVIAKGEADPKADNSTLSGRKTNRRVTVVVR